MTYLIDYRVGGMGNTIFAHIVYACNKINLDLDTLFSPKSGHAHAAKRWHSKELLPLHIIENPELVPSNSTCLLEIKTSLWYKLLEIKMGYSKHILKTPNLTNILKFFPIIIQDNNNQTLWNEFYQNIKDPSWPECESFDSVSNLPAHIQTEIYKVYKPPIVTICSSNFLSLLTIAYYDVLMEFKNTHSMFGGAVLLLDDYFNNDVSIIKSQVIDKLGWSWDDQKSVLFHQAVIKNNQRYVDWLDHLKDLLKKTLDQQVIQLNLDPWEKALWLAAICVQYNKSPRKLHWNAIGEINSNKELITILKE